MIAKRFLPIFFFASIAAAPIFVEASPAEYKSNTGGNWTSASTWNLLNPASTYPQSNAMSFSIEGSNKTLTLDTDVTVGRMIGGGGHFDNWNINGTGKITFDVLYDSTNSYNFAASALWGHGELIYNNTGGVVYSTTDAKTTGWEDTVGIKIFNTKAGSSLNQTLTYNTSVTATEVTSMYGKSSSVSVVNFNGNTILTDYYINSGTTNFNSTATYANLKVQTGGVANIAGTATGNVNVVGTLNISGSVVSGAITGSGTVNFTGDYTKNDGKAVAIDYINTKGSGIINFNHVGEIVTGYQYYESAYKTTIAAGATVKIGEDSTVGDSWGDKYIFQTGGSSVLTVNGTIDATNYSGGLTTTKAYFIKNWGKMVLNSTAVIVYSGNVKDTLYMGRESTLEINGNAVISGATTILMNQTDLTTSSKLILNNSSTLSDKVLAFQKDNGSQHAAAGSITNSYATLLGEVSIGSFKFNNTFDQIQIDLTDCTSLVLQTLFSNVNSNPNGGKIIFSGFKNNCVYITDTTNIDLDTIGDYVMTDDGVKLTIIDNYLYGEIIPEPAVCGLLIALAAGVAIMRRRRS